VPPLAWCIPPTVHGFSSAQSGACTLALIGARGSPFRQPVLVRLYANPRPTLLSPARNAQKHGFAPADLSRCRVEPSARTNPKDAMTQQPDRTASEPGAPEPPRATADGGLPSGYSVPAPRPPSDAPYGAATYLAAPWPGPPPAPKPGVIPLRPLGVAEILGGAMSYIRANLKVTLGLAALIATIVELIDVPVTAFVFDGLQRAAAVPSGLEPTQLTGGALGALSFSILIGFVSSTVLTGMLIAVLGRAVVGERPTLGEVWAAARPRLLGLIGIGLLTVLALSALLVGGFAPLVIALVLGAPMWLTFTLVLLAIAVSLCAVFLWVSWSLAQAAYVLEDTSMFGAFARSVRLVRGQWWRMFGILLLGWIITEVLGAVLLVPFIIGAEFATATAASNGMIGLLGLSISAIGTILATAVTSPFAVGVVGLLYFDQRIRGEGLDIELAHNASALAASAPAEATAGADATHRSQPPPRPR
jgi:hypothetical protein